MQIAEQMGPPLLGFMIFMTETGSGAKQYEVCSQTGEAITNADAFLYLSKSFLEFLGARLQR